MPMSFVRPPSLRLSIIVACPLPALHLQFGLPHLRRSSYTVPLTIGSRSIKTGMSNSTSRARSESDWRMRLRRSSSVCMWIDLQQTELAVKGEKNEAASKKLRITSPSPRNILRRRYRCGPAGPRRAPPHCLNCRKLAERKNAAETFDRMVVSGDVSHVSVPPQSHPEFPPPSNRHSLR